MQVLSLKLNEYKNINNSKQKINTPNQTLKTSYPMTQNQIYFNPAYCVSFSGACVDLSKAMKTLKATEILKEDIRLPKRVEDLANSVLRRGNTQNLTLIDVHKQAYFDIMYVKSLEDVRARFSEFSKVLSIDELETKPQNGSFLRDILDGKNEYFSKDNDITLQLMKMYWGEGFSLADLEKQMGIKSSTFSSVMKILNIPLRNKHYASVLKHSDPDASKRIADMIAATKSANFEKVHGYVSIPKGHLPVAHSQKILESLFEYYEKDPSRIYSPPKNIRDFYEDNILAKEIYRATLFEMWNFGSMKNVKRNLLCFFDKKSGNTSYTSQKLSGYYPLSEKENLWISEYFAINKKDKDTFSRSLRSAYKHIVARLEAEKTKKTDVVLYPKKMQDEVLKYYEKIGRDKSEFIPNLLRLEEARGLSVPVCGRISINCLLRDNQKIDIAYTKSLFDTFNFTNELMSRDNSKASKEVKQLLSKVFTQHRLYGLDSNTAMNLYLNICNTLIKAKKDDFVKAISMYLERSAKFSSDFVL